MSAAIDLELVACDVTDKLENIRLTLGIKDRAEFWSMTLVEVAAALTRVAFCAKHGSHRVMACEICRRLEK